MTIVDQARHVNKLARFRGDGEKEIDENFYCNSKHEHDFTKSRINLLVNICGYGKLSKYQHFHCLKFLLLITQFLAPISRDLYALPSLKIGVLYHDPRPRFYAAFAQRNVCY